MDELVRLHQSAQVVGSDITVQGREFKPHDCLGRFTTGVAQLAREVPGVWAANPRLTDVRTDRSGRAENLRRHRIPFFVRPGSRQGMNPHCRVDRHLVHSQVFV